jgi:AraC-like DNA-binding protein
MRAFPGPVTQDPLGAALHDLRLTGVFYAHAELTAPWGLTMPTFDGQLWFHIVVDGGCTLRMAPGNEVELRAGDMALVPKGGGHRLATSSHAPYPLVTDLPEEVGSERYSRLRHGGGGPATTLVCGIVGLHHHAAHQIVDVLPEVVHLPAARSIDAGWMDRTLAVMAAEARTPRMGGETVLTRLADVLVVHAIRVWLDGAPEARRGWLGALHDPHLGGVLQAIHRNPSRDWTVADLAAIAALSRSAFAARFTELLGIPPLRYVTEVRMRQAAGALAAEPELTVAEAGRRAGYASEAAFNRAFRRTMGAPPGTFRAAS